MTTNPHNVNQALTWLLAQTFLTSEDWYNECDGLQARAHGFAHSNESTALAHWRSLRFNPYRRGPKRAWNPGDLLFWDEGAGHVVTAADDPRYAYTNDLAPDGTTDPRGAGRVHYTRIDVINRSWGKPFLGSIRPDKNAFPHAIGHVSLPPYELAAWPTVSLAALRNARRTDKASTDVLHLQRALIAAGFLTLPRDNGGQLLGYGKFGPLTLSAWIRALQKIGNGPLYTLRYLGVHSHFVAAP